MFSSYWLFDSDAEFAGTIPGRVAVANQTVQRPLTPWFVPVGSHESASSTSKRINAVGFKQFDNLEAKTDVGPPDAPEITFGEVVVFPGFERYLVESATSDWSMLSNPDPHDEEDSYSFSGTQSYAFVFSESPPSAGWVFTQDPAPPYDIEGLSYIKTYQQARDHGRSGFAYKLTDGTSTTYHEDFRQVLVDNVDEDTVAYSWRDAGDYHVTLSGAIDLIMLSSILDEWLSKSKDFRLATGDDDLFSHATESSDGRASCAGSVLELDLPNFAGGAAIHNGSFSGWVCLAKMRNGPVAYGEITTTSGWPYYRRGTSGSYGFPNGFNEVSLSDEVTGVWADTSAPWGEFTDDDPLASCPQEAAKQWGSVWVEPGKAYELTLISRTGRRYRVTFEAGRGPGPFGEPPVVLGDVVMVTDPATLRAVYLGEVIDEGGAYGLTLKTIEVYLGDESGWEVVADADAYLQYLDDLDAWHADWNAWVAGGKIGDEPVKPTAQKDPEGLIGTDVTGHYLLLCAVRARRGEAFGFSALDGSASRYRTRHVEIVAETPEYSDDGDTWIHGNPPPSGVQRLAYTESYLYGSGAEGIKSVAVEEWSASLGMLSVALDDSQLCLDIVDQLLPSSNVGTTVTLTPTLRRIEIAVPWQHEGHSSVAYDSPSFHGFIAQSAYHTTGSYAHNNPSFISEEWVPFSVTWDGTKNVADPIVLPAPDPGTTVRFAGFRLTY